MNGKRVLWIKVWGIAALQGAITLSWVIYNLYLPLLLVQLGFSQQFAIALLIVENLLEAIIEPVFGFCADRQQDRLGTKIPTIIIGVALSSGLFLTIPSFTIFNEDRSNLRWLFPVLVVAWASAMAIFRSPAMALLGRCAVADRLPQAASILTFVGGIVGAFRFDAYGFILNLGAGFAFALGSCSLLVAGAILRWLHPPELPRRVNNPSSKVKIAPLILLLTIGILMGWGLRFLLPTIDRLLTQELGRESGKIAMTVFFLALSMFALPAGKIGAKLGNVSAMKLGCVTIAIALPFALLVPPTSLKYIAIACLSLGFSLVLNGAIPFALSAVDAANSGLGLGMYFGGLNGGIGLFQFVFSKLDQTNMTLGTFGAVLSFMLVFFCLDASSKLLKNHPV